MSAHLSFVKKVAGRAQTTTGVLSLPFGNNGIPLGTTSGNALIALVAIKSTTITISSITDSRSNTWVVNYSPAAGTNSRVFIASCLNPTALMEGDTIDIAWSAATSVPKYATVLEVAGLIPSAAFDKSATANGNGTALASGATAALAQNDEFAFGAHVTDGITGDNLTDGGGFTTADTEFITGGKFYAQYRIITAGGTPNAQGTLSGSARNWVSGIATYKASTVIDERVEAAALVAEEAGNTLRVEAGALVAESGGPIQQVSNVAFVVEYALDAPVITGSGILYKLVAE